MRPPLQPCEAISTDMWGHPYIYVRLWLQECEAIIIAMCGHHCASVRPSRHSYVSYVRPSLQLGEAISTAMLCHLYVYVCEAITESASYVREAINKSTSTYVRTSQHLRICGHHNIYECEAINTAMWGLLYISVRPSLPLREAITKWMWGHHNIWTYMRTWM